MTDENLHKSISGLSHAMASLNLVCGGLASFLLSPALGSAWENLEQVGLEPTGLALAAQPLATLTVLLTVASLVCWPLISDKLRALRTQSILFMGLVPSALCGAHANIWILRTLFDGLG